MPELESIKRLLHKKSIRLSLVVAQTKEGIIGLGDEIPWHIPEDLRFFKKTTIHAQLIMGRRTFESIVARLGRPLPKRRTIVLSRSLAKNPPSREELGFSRPFGEEAHESLTFAGDLLSAVEALQEARPAFVAGGAQIYAAFEPWISEAWITLVNLQTSEPEKKQTVRESSANEWICYDAFSRLQARGLQVQKEEALSRQASVFFLQ